MTQAPEQPTEQSADQPNEEAVEAHSGQHAVAVARAHGVEVMFTLSGAHVFPMYDGAVTADPPMRIIDVRHEQTATFAAEAMGKLTRTPGLAVLTAGRGRWPSPGQPLGHGLPARARPAPDHRAGLQAGTHYPHRRRGGGGHAPGVRRRRLLAPWTGVRGHPDGRVLQLLVLHPAGRRRAHPYL